MPFLAPLRSTVVPAASTFAPVTVTVLGHIAPLSGLCGCREPLLGGVAADVRARIGTTVHVLVDVATIGGQVCLSLLALRIATP
ncbi:hypothetical protein, partial [Nocardia cyriacigeorgica]|uniref:hypothetical protein n=1 Tax=Nocardia cyriacigeorgica TaxID=135487 RepID=UPI001C49A0DB